MSTNKLEKRGVLEAITIGSILEAFKTFITEKLGGRTENELWLEKITQIPKKNSVSSVVADSVKYTK